MPRLISVWYFIKISNVSCQRPGPSLAKKARPVGRVDGTIHSVRAEYCGVAHLVAASAVIVDHGRDHHSALTGRQPRGASAVGPLPTPCSAAAPVCPQLEDRSASRRFVEVA